MLFDTDRLSYLKQLVQLRYQYTSLFRSARMLRPPVVTCDAKPVVTSPALWFKDDLVMEQVLAGAWQARSGERLVDVYKRQPMARELVVIATLVALTVAGRAAFYWACLLYTSPAGARSAGR